MALEQAGAPPTGDSGDSGDSDGSGDSGDSDIDDSDDSDGDSGDSDIDDSDDSDGGGDSDGSDSGDLDIVDARNDYAPDSENDKYDQTDLSDGEYEPNTKKRQHEQMEGNAAFAKDMQVEQDRIQNRVYAVNAEVAAEEKRIRAVKKRKRMFVGTAPSDDDDMENFIAPEGSVEPEGCSSDAMNFDSDQEGQ